MNTIRTQFIIALSALLVALLPFSVFTVSVIEKAVLLQFQDIKQTNFKPGLYFKIPFIQQVRKFDNRRQILDAKPEVFLTKGKKFVLVDSYVIWRINDEAAYFKTTGGDEFTAQRLIAQKINAGLRDEFGLRELPELVTGERRQIMEILREQAEERTKDLGIKIDDVKIKRIDFPEDVSAKVYDRMRSERDRVAKELRSKGAEAAERIRADADRQRTEILADAYRQSQTIRGEGDATAAETYAKAYSRNEEFFNLYRSLEAYRNTFNNQGDLIVLEPDSEFFKYFKNAMGTSP